VILNCLGEVFFRGFEVSGTSDILSQFFCDCWLFEKEED